MKSLQEHLSLINIKELKRKDFVRRKLITEFTQRLNAERSRDNEEKILKYMHIFKVFRPQAVKALKAEKDKSKKIWPLWTERSVWFKVNHLDTPQLQDFLDMCNTAEKDRKSFGKVFNGSLKIK